MGKKTINWGNDEEFISKCYELQETVKIAAFYNCDRTSVRNHAKQIGFDLQKAHKKSKLSLQDKEYIKDMYHHKTSQQLCEELNVTRGMITKIWYDCNLIGKESRVYKLEHQDIFHTIDTDEKAYWLGFIMADGSVSEKNASKNSQNILRITLQKNDYNHLIKFNNFIGTDKPLHYSRHANKIEQEYVTVEVVSNQVVEDLNNLGCIPRKTYENIWVNLDTDELQFAFIRGFFDGDGGITNNFSEKQLYKARVSIAGFHKNLKEFQKFLEKYKIQSMLTLDKRISNQEHGDFGHLVLKNKMDNYIFLQKIYPVDCPVYLERKFLLAKKYKELFLKSPNSWRNSTNADNKSSKIGEVLQINKDNTEVISEMAKGSETPQSVGIE